MSNFTVPPCFAIQFPGLPYLVVFADGNLTRPELQIARLEAFNARPGCGTARNPRFEGPSEILDEFSLSPSRNS